MRQSIILLAFLLAACTSPTVPTPEATSAATQPTALPAATAVSAATAVATATAALETAAPTAAPTAVAATPAIVPTGPPFARTLSLQQPAVFGYDVQVVQQRLVDLGYTQVGDVDGIFGPNTETAVRAFQTLNQIEVDGVVGETTWSLLFDPAAVVYALQPIVDADSGYLLGAANGSDWLEGLSIAPLLGATEYRLLSQTGVAGTATGSAPELTQVPCEFTPFVAFDPQIDETRPIGITGGHNPLPRAITDVPTDDARLQAPIAGALQVLGLQQPTVRITRALAADLDGNGSQETVVAATFRGDGETPPLPNAAVGDYSALLFIPANANLAVVIAADVHTAAIEFGAPLVFELVGIWDLNGDGGMEIVAHSDYYEGASTSVYTFDGAATNEVLAMGCGV